ncbi:hypothetical protein Phi12:1_gp31 [Cellulophaga phage phi12:1]|uniref:Uncharacterized protein n=2 Tax=Cellulophaga phage phi12:1 TaxID=1327976 RepID=S0A0G1_9CAUD|nr:hypothetical protein Phi12:1_gp31 [Cellulophaga phage phi12:1]AGO47997.1 hypothetical protein Phi12:1_gp31 [Cellulophaga phage phi12:1]AGO48162.1 hypothetical protein Phi12:3_gp31 [Cellulophaga phage phi12:3]
MKNYIDSEQHWEDSVNADHDYMEAMEKEESNNREHPFLQHPYISRFIYGLYNLLFTFRILAQNINSYGIH